MRFFKPLSSILIAAFFIVAARAPSSAQVYISLFPPPAMPVYNQPPVPGPNYMWNPGYWAWGPAGYYWVPGTWVQPPQTGLLWTPGYWGYNGGQYAWNTGYWGPQVGYYGGINYGAGYYGNGYAGGMWQGPTFAYNTAVTNAPPTIVRNTYVNRTVIIHNTNYTSYNGGAHGVTVRPTSSQLAYEHQQHIAMTPEQHEHMVQASENRNNLAKVNGGKPPTAAVSKPLTVSNRPPDFKPVTATDKHNAQPVAHPQQAHPQEHPPQAHPQQAHPEHPQQAHPDQAHPTDKPDDKKPPR